MRKPAGKVSYGVPLHYVCKTFGHLAFGSEGSAVESESGKWRSIRREDVKFAHGSHCWSGEHWQGPEIPFAFVCALRWPRKQEQGTQKFANPTWWIDCVYNKQPTRPSNELKVKFRKHAFVWVYMCVSTWYWWHHVTSSPLIWFNQLKSTLRNVRLMLLQGQTCLSRVRQYLQMVVARALFMTIYFPRDVLQLFSSKQPRMSLLPDIWSTPGRCQHVRSKYVVQAWTACRYTVTPIRKLLL